LAKVTTPALINAYQNIDLSENYVSQVLAAQSKSRDARLAAVKKLADGGIPLMVGTDSGDLGVVFGYSTHREMALMVKAGVPTWQALAAGTTLPKKFLGRTSGIQKGDRADLVVLSGNPVDDIENTQTVEMVFKDGTLLENARLIKRAK
jgi:imidazolonepropionase-like amidohydrolase